MKHVEPRDHQAAPLEVAIATEQTLFRDALTRLLNRDPTLKIVGQAQNERDLMRVLAREKPRTLLFDYEALGANGESVIARLRRAAPGTRILVMSDGSGSEHAGRVLRAGASGLVGKHLNYETLIRAIHAVARGEIWADRKTTASALERLTARPLNAADRLTERQLEIADAVVQGLRNKEIAKRLSISQKTVKSHLNNIFRKLRLDGRVALGALVQERGDRLRT